MLKIKFSRFLLVLIVFVSIFSFATKVSAISLYSNSETIDRVGSYNPTSMVATPTATGIIDNVVSYGVYLSDSPYGSGYATLQRFNPVTLSSLDCQSASLLVSSLGYGAMSFADGYPAETNLPFAIAHSTKAVVSVSGAQCDVSNTTDLVVFKWVSDSGPVVISIAHSSNLLAPNPYYTNVYETSLFELNSNSDTCFDGIKNQNETGIDVGGVCLIYSSEKAITSFSFKSLTPNVDGIIDDTRHTITLSVRLGTNVAALLPTIDISSGAYIYPNSNISQNFSSPVAYTVTAGNGSTQAYIVTVVG